MPDYDETMAAAEQFLANARVMETKTIDQRFADIEAKEKVRRIRTREGARRFGGNIGDIIDGNGRVIPAAGLPDFSKPKPKRRAPRAGRQKPRVQRTGTKPKIRMYPDGVTAEGMKDKAELEAVLSRSTDTLSYDRGIGHYTNHINRDGTESHIGRNPDTGKWVIWKTDANGDQIEGSESGPFESAKAAYTHLRTRPPRKGASPKA